MSVVYERAHQRPQLETTMADGTCSVFICRNPFMNDEAVWEEPRTASPFFNCDCIGEKNLVCCHGGAVNGLERGQEL